MTDVIKDALDAVGIAVLDNAFESERDDGMSFARKLIVFFHHLQHHELDEEMMKALDRTGYARTVWYGDEMRLFNHLVERLEKQR